MDEITSNPRAGIIDNIEVVYSITAVLNNGVVRAANGLILSPVGLHEKFKGTIKELVDVRTLHKFYIMVAPYTFSFMGSYKNLNSLL